MDMDENDPNEEENSNEEEEEEDPNEEDDSGEEEDSDGDGTETDQQTAAEIERLKDVILTNPFSYDDYVKLISLLRSAGELEDVREVREQFAKRFPLSPSLWKEWICDEERMATTPEEKQSVIDLFERAVQDYVSVDLWVEYCQFMMSLMNTQSGLEKVREVVSKAISFVGLDPSQGSLIWSFWIEFEKALLQLATTEEDRKSQVEKIYDVYRRMLRVPHLSMEETLEEFVAFVEEMKESVPFPDVERVKSEYESTLKKLQQLIPYEESLLKADESSRREEYMKYIEFAESKCDPATTQSLYERSVTNHCLHVDLWTKYVDYLESRLKSLDVSSRVLFRATRNCPWSSLLWIKYLRCLERYSVPRNEVIQVFERGLKAGFQSGSDFLHLWTAYLDYTRRVTDFSDEKDVASLRKSFVMAADHLAAIPDADPNFSILQYSAKVEAAHCNSLQVAREIWDNMMQLPILSSQALLWVEFFNLERLHGDLHHAKLVLSRGLKLSCDWPETIGQLLIKLEREEGTSLNDFEDALNKYEKTIKRVAKRRAAEAEKSRLGVAQKPKKDQKKNVATEAASSSRKRKAEPSKNRPFNDDMFKIPAVPNVKRSRNEEPGSKPELCSKPELGSKPELSSKPESVPHYVKPKDSRDKGNDLQTVFVSNLDFSVDDEKLREVFSQFGSVVDVRLVRNYKGLSKGFGYIEFADMESTRKAVKNDRMKIGERPCFISEVNKRVGFKFKSDVEKNKLFVSNLESEVTSDQLRNIFLKYGDLKDVRIVTYRNGHSKGCAYVEFTDEIGAANGLKADGLLLGNKNVKVEISNPKRAGIKLTPQPVKTLGSSTMFGESGCVKTQLSILSFIS